MGRRRRTLPCGLRGARFLSSPGRLLQLLGGIRDARPGQKWAVRALGARHIIQGLAVARVGAKVTKVALSIDLLHGATDICLAFLKPRWRRAGLADLAVQAGLSLMDTSSHRPAGTPLAQAHLALAHLARAGSRQAMWRAVAGSPAGIDRAS